MRRFNLWDERGDRHCVAEGVVFGGDNMTVVRWSGDNPSLVIWPEWRMFEEISVSGHDHEGKLIRSVQWVDL